MTTCDRCHQEAVNHFSHVTMAGVFGRFVDCYLEKPIDLCQDCIEGFQTLVKDYLKPKVRGDQPAPYLNG